MTTSTIQTAYTQWAASYDSDRNLTRDLDQLVTHSILGERQYRSILELGCGTGKNTQLLAQIGDHVHGIDFSAGMLAQARAKGFGSSVTFSEADLTHSWPCADQSIDLITCNLVLEHIADLRVVFAEASRTLVPTGHLFICELHPFKQYLGSKATFQQNETRIEVPAFVHHISEFLDIATNTGFILTSFKEWWHTDDQDTPPRLVSFMFSRKTD